MQGFFGGGLQPNQQAIILDTFPPEKRGMAFSITAVATIVAPVIGPVLGGWITDNYTWRWIFFINIPVSIGLDVLRRHRADRGPALGRQPAEAARSTPSGWG